MEDRKVILTVYSDQMGLDFEIDADGGQLLLIIKSLAEAMIEDAGEETH